jgi:hypothetical protein
MIQWVFFSFFFGETFNTKKLAKLIKLMLEKKIQKFKNSPIYLSKIAKTFQEENTGMTTLLVYSSVGWFLLL